MLENALLFDEAGQPIRQDQRTRSRDWDEVQEFCHEVYMPYRVEPLGRRLKPDATMRSARIGRVTMTRFSYGVPIHLDTFDPDAGNIIVLNTIRGGLRHMVDAHSDTETAAGDSFVVDCSRAEYWLDADDAHMQVNLTIPHDVVAEIAERWYGFVPDDRLWTTRLKFGGPGSSWLALMDYAARRIRAESASVADGRFAAHLEETICLELLRAWADGAGMSLETGARMAAPHYVRAAEEIIEATARDAPTVGAVAAGLGVSVRTLSEGFRRFRGITPRAFLRDRRLDGVRADLAAAPKGATVASVAADWGYVNFGALAAAYRRRFGEPPSWTLKRARRS